MTESEPTQNEQQAEDEADDQDAGPASQPSGAAAGDTGAESEDPDAGPASVPD
ncbi:hypothetical protein SAMN04487968_11393 [Nocardioides terrae]|uniref:Uncharacterized protein n=1 Tax=Nocardioides terrae TaxID=574651 RepID=A0A1I1MVI7_9ACTN|nr:hypothetical protein [Nocardioides terrae]SFC89165.1 hypothetical protein SAMN04487968_11393 [Nocardioides terrae]